MPYHDRIFPDRGLGVLSIYGKVSGDTFIEATASMSNEGNWSPSFDRLWDCRGIPFLDMTLQDVEVFIRTQMEGRGRAARGALVASRDLDATMGPLLQAAFRKDRPVGVFRSMEEALVWLGTDLLPEEIGASQG